MSASFKCGGIHMEGPGAAFETLVREWTEAVGDDNLSGTIAAKSDFVLVESPAGIDPETFVDAVIKDGGFGSAPARYADESLDIFKKAANIYGDRRGPALCVPSASGGWWFCGLTVGPWSQILSSDVDRSAFEQYEARRKEERAGAERDQVQVGLAVIAAGITGFVVAILWQPMFAADGVDPAREIGLSQLVAFMFASAISCWLILTVRVHGSGRWTNLAPFFLPLLAIVIWALYFNPLHQDQTRALEINSAYFSSANFARSFVTDKNGDDFTVCGDLGVKDGKDLLCSQIDIAAPNHSAVWGSFRSPFVEYDDYPSYRASDCAGRSTMCDESSR